MVDVFVHRTGLDIAAVEERRDLVQIITDGGKLQCDGFDLIRVDIEYSHGLSSASALQIQRGSSRHLLPAGVKVHVLFL